MYAWIWRRLPFGLPGKIIASVGLALGAAALLWYFVFPWAEPLLLPFDDVQVGTDPGTPGLGPDGSPDPSASAGSEDEFDIPYDIESNNPAPGRSG